MERYYVKTRDIFIDFLENGEFSHTFLSDLFKDPPDFLENEVDRRVEVYVDTGDEYGEGIGVNFTYTFYRFETDEEYYDRLKKEEALISIERSKNEKFKKIYREMERREYERLRAIFEKEIE